MIRFDNDWDEVIKDLIESPLYASIRAFLKSEYGSHTVYPPMDKIFTAFKATPYSAVKAVILGQDPYHEPGQAHGLSFSVNEGVPLPPSLQNIFKELKDDLGIDNGKNGCLEGWAEQGVMLLNATLTVRRGQANSHSECGWREFTDEVIKKLSDRIDPIVFILWGGYARGKKKLIDTSRHFVIESAHPSPLSAYNGFFGSKPFSKTNGILTKLGKTPIDWKLKTHNNQVIG